MLMAFISHEVAEVSSEMAGWKGRANKVNELSQNFLVIKQVPKHPAVLTFSHSSFLDPYADLVPDCFFIHNIK